MNAAEEFYPKIYTVYSLELSLLSQYTIQCNIQFHAPRIKLNKSLSSTFHSYCHGKDFQTYSLTQKVLFDCCVSISVFQFRTDKEHSVLLYSVYFTPLFYTHVFHVKQGISHVLCVKLGITF